MTKNDLKRYSLPDEPGIYIFRKGRKILYIGKATSLRDRVRSYFAADIPQTRGLHIQKMVAEADGLRHQTTQSVLEALILEANLIKRHTPPYNAMSKDNKSFNYLVVTKERFPRVLAVRGRELYQNWKDSDIKRIYGPFPQGLALQDAMKIVRKIFPYRDSKCTPCEEQLKRGSACRPCFNRQIGLCPGVCTGEMTREAYAQQIRHICTLFSGNFKGLKRQLTREMREAARRQEFELASMLRRQCAALEHIKDVSLIKEERVSAGGGARIEAFDVAHTAGQETVAVMTVVMNGEAYKAAYRMFKILSATNNDVAALKEALERRLNHPEWPLPRVFVIDGSTAQMNAARLVLRKKGIEVPLVGVVKDERHRPKNLIGDKRAIEAFERDILLANNEAHRFAIGWHRRRRAKASLR